MKFTFARANRPRNPMVAPALMRRAGSHRSSAAAERQHGQRQLAREIRHALGSASQSTPAPEPYSP